MIVPCRITKDDADRFVFEHHRTHDPDQGCRFVVGAWDMQRDCLCGVAVVGNPRAPALTALGTVVEVTRCCTDGTRDACSWLYARAAEHARINGWLSIITYTLKSEGGASLRAAGWWREGREDDHIHADMRWLKLLNEVFRAAPPEPAEPSTQLSICGWA